ncbi:MAG: hydroxyacylglutathione hydrolase [Paracoccaceae bacterium]|jgi:hydroxyacylglutathione hydrolase
MTLEIVTIPCLADNYAFLLRDQKTSKVALVDAPESYPIQKALQEKGWMLDMILLTHHHYDHVDGLPELVEEYHPLVIGTKADANRLPRLDLALNEGDTFSIGESEAHVIDVSGHTIGHIAFHFPSANAVFTADSLMALGCGRLFEGTPEMMWASLSKLAALPTNTIVYSGHEYTASNAKFALTVDPDNSALQARAADITARRSKGIPTVPSTLADELATNPFLRAHLPEMKTAVGMEGATDVEVFAAIRKQKDNF